MSDDNTDNAVMRGNDTDNAAMSNMIQMMLQQVTVMQRILQKVTLVWWTYPHHYVVVEKQRIQVKSKPPKSIRLLW